MEIISGPDPLFGNPWMVHFSCGVTADLYVYNDSPVGEGEPTAVIPGNNQPLPSGHQQQDVPVPGHS